MLSVIVPSLPILISSVQVWIGICCSLLSAIAIWLAAPRKVRLVAGRAARLG